MNNTEILIITNEPYQGNNFSEVNKTTFVSSVEYAIELMYQRAFDIIVMENAIDEELKKKVRTLNGLKNDETIIIEYTSVDADYSEALRKARNKKSMRNFGHMEFHEQN